MNNVHLKLIVALPVVFLCPSRSVVLAAGELTPQQRAIVNSVASGGSGSGWTGLTTAQLDSLSSKAGNYLHDYQQYHLPHGLNADVWFTDFSRSAVNTYPNLGYLGLGDSATFTGHYLSALSLRYYNVTDPVMKQQTLNSINSTLDKLSMLTEVSGRSGFIARHAVPIASVDPNLGPMVPGGYVSYYSDYNHFKNRSQVYPALGPDAFTGTYNGTLYGWLGATERDTYVGVNLGLATALAKVADSTVQSKVRTIIDSVITNLTDNSWYIRDGQDAGPLGINNYRVSVTSTLKAALLRTAATADPAKYRSTYNTAAAGASSSNSLASGSSYYANNLEFAMLYSLNVLEQQDTATNYDSKWAARLQSDWEQASTHLNAQFAGVYLSALRNAGDLRAVATLHGELADFPAGPKWARIDNGSTNTSTAQHVTDRKPDDFIWQRSPFELHDLGSQVSLEYPGLDVILPYWLGVDAGVMAAMLPVPGDANGDGKVDSTDAGIIASHWGTTTGAVWADGDFNSDDAVNAADASLMAANWHHGVSESSTVPEPCSLAILVGIIGTGLVLLHRRMA